MPKAPMPMGNIARGAAQRQKKENPAQEQHEQEFEKIGDLLD